MQVTIDAEDASAKLDPALDLVGQPRRPMSGRDGTIVLFVAVHIVFQRQEMRA